MPRGETDRIKFLIKAATDILEEQHPMTIRQLFYQLVSIEMEVNTTAGYKRIIRVMTIARKDERCDYDWIVDRSRPVYGPNVFVDVEHYMRRISRGYRKDYWEMQPNYVEIFVEKDAIVGSIEDTTDALGIDVRVGKGYVSTTKIHETAQRFASIDKPITVFYLGDFDPSGEGIEADIKRRLLEHGSGEFKMVRLAIHGGDIKTYKLPPQRAKVTDSRTGDFIKKHRSNRTVELDALPPDVLRRRITQAVDGLKDMVSWNRAVLVEQVELRSIKEFIKGLPKKSA